MARLARTTAVFLFASATAVPAFAQGGYIGAFLVADVARFDQYERTGRDDSGNGEALGFALRLGTGLGPKWGVELEFVRPGEISSDVVPDILPLLTDEDPFGVDSFATHHVPLDQAPEAYANFREKKEGTVKVLLKP